ncbi:MAG: Na+/H+ antiporter NhaA [Calditrichia bacterium]
MKKNIKPEKSVVDGLLRPIQSFIKLEASGGIVLLIAAIVALVWANSPLKDIYSAIWEMPVVLGFGGLVIDKPLLLWINDGLMAIFFFVIGLEIKREILFGELSSPKQAILPIAAAIGGMVLPALVYLAVTHGTPAAAGWGIPMATDIAFALGVLALLGSRVPFALKIFLTALAIVDDLGAILVIALFYTAEVYWSMLILGGVLLVVLMVLNISGVRSLVPYLAIGFVIWIAFLKSGVHATIAGVLIAMTIPARPLLSFSEFQLNMTDLTDALRSNVGVDNQEKFIHEVEEQAHDVGTPLHRLEHSLHAWVAFFIIPVFALANAGVTIEGDFMGAVTSPVSIGIILGLVVGKQLGIFSCCWLAVKSGLTELPAGVTWRHIYGVSALAGIGFTMSLFIAMLGFGESELLTFSKVGILIASLLSGIFGWIMLSGGKAKS